MTNPATLRDCEANAFILHGLIQAYEEIHDSNTPQAFHGRGALLSMMERIADEQSSAISLLADKCACGGEA